MVGILVCAITSVGTPDSAVVPEIPHTSINAGPPLTTSVLPSMLDGIGPTSTPAFAADARRRAALNVSEPVACETTPKLTGPETPLGNEAGVRTGNPACAAAEVASLSCCSFGASGSHLTSPQ